MDCTYPQSIQHINLRQSIRLSQIDMQVVTFTYMNYEKLDSPVVSALRLAIAEVKQRWSVLWVTKNLLSRAPPCFGRPVKQLVPAAFAVVSTSGCWPALGPRGSGPFSLCVINKESLCPSSGDINRLMMMLMMTWTKVRVGLKFMLSLL
jgi:hypothetical protein